MQRKIWAALWLLLLAIPAIAQTSLDSMVERFRVAYNNDAYDSVYGMLSQRSQSFVTLAQLKQGMAAVKTSNGKLDSIRFLQRQDSISYYRAYFRVHTLRLLTWLDANRKLGALRFMPESVRRIPEKGSSELALVTSSGTLHGTLTMPQTDKKVPVVLLIAGSGPTDRDGNNSLGVKTDAYKLLADSLAKAGIACVRYDKRGVGESADALKSESLVTFDTIVSDACAFIDKLAADERFSSVVVAGHSEGSLVGMLAAGRMKVQKYISIAGAGFAAEDVLLTQINEQRPAEAADAQLLMDSLKAGYDVKNVPAALSDLLKPYMRAWLKYDPAVEIKKLKMPVLIVQGMTDLQVSAANARVLHKALPSAKLVLIENMNHVLKDAPADKGQNLATYYNAALPIKKELVESIISFIKE